MGEVAITYSVMPASPETDIQKLQAEIKKALPANVKLRGMVVKPVAFGLNAIHLLVVTNDEEGAGERIESALTKIEGIQSIDTVDITLL